jgi:ribosomal protein S18 acetylase RimI-like enzyme
MNKKGNFNFMIYSFQDQKINFAASSDIAAVRDLLNNAYRGEGSKQGWTTEANLIDGDIRTTNEMLQEVIEQAGSVILIYKEDEKIVGCVNLQQHGSRLYLGMFSVSPQLQGVGIGKKLLQAAEEYAEHVNCTTIYMSVISVRSELIDWYKRHGYIDTGERKPFAEDGITGKHLQPLAFMTMEKSLH